MPARANVIREVLARMERMGPDVLSLAGGMPGAHAYPHRFEAHLHQAFAGAAAPGAVMGYGDPRGHAPLRRAVADLAASWGMEMAQRELLITTGGQQGLYLAARTLLKAGDTVVVPKPTYPGALQMFQLCGLTLQEAQTDEQGLLVDDALEQLLARGARCIYLIPDFDNPTGATLPEPRRQRLLALAARFDAWVIEDLAYRELRYDGIAPDLLSAACRGQEAQRVVTVASFSKSVMPSLRTGWVSAAPALIERMTQHLQALQLTGSPPLQAALTAFLQDGYAEHLATVRAGYRQRRDALADALRRHFPQARLQLPQGGFFVRQDLTPGVDESAVFEYALEAERVACIPGAGFSASGTPGGFLRLCFSTLDEPSLAEAVHRLARAHDRVGGQALQQPTAVPA